MRKYVFLAATLLVACAAFADTGTVLLLYTNDVHDHLRSDYDGVGGMTHIAAYARQMRAQRDDVLLVDAGDLLEKGDMAPHATGGWLTFEAFARAGYDAVVPGNHDVNDLALLRRVARETGLPLVCANMTDENGEGTLLPPALVVDVDGVKVGVIGLTRYRKRAEVFGAEQSARALAEQAARLEPETHLLVALVHEGIRECADLSRAVPDVDVFVSGHTHQQTREPHRVEETGALVVQAGAMAKHVGRLELTVDLEQGGILAADNALVVMDHAEVPADPEFSAWLREEEARHAPLARTPAGRTGKPLGYGDMAWVLAEAFRIAGDGDIGLCMADRVIRGGLPAAELDANAVFRVVAPWAHDMVAVDCSGAVLIEYLEAHALTWSRPAWAGFAATFERDEDRKVRMAGTDLDPARTYRVVLTKKEWEDRLSDHCDATAEPLDGSSFHILLDYLRGEYVAAHRENLEVLAEALNEAANSPPVPLETQ